MEQSAREQKTDEAKPSQLLVIRYRIVGRAVACRSMGWQAGALALQIRYQV
jgi:hypothetical protein